MTPIGWIQKTEDIEKKKMMNQRLLFEVPAEVVEFRVESLEPVTPLNRIVVFTWYSPGGFWKIWPGIEDTEHLSTFNFPTGHTRISIVEIKQTEQQNEPTNPKNSGTGIEPCR